MQRHQGVAILRKIDAQERRLRVPKGKDAYSRYPNVCANNQVPGTKREKEINEKGQVKAYGRN